MNFSYSLPFSQPGSCFPQPLIRNSCAFTHIRFGLIPFRSPLLRESIFLSFPWVTKMFQFSQLYACTYAFSADCQGFTLTGCPIRRSPAQRSLSTSPKLIAATPRPSSVPTTEASTAHPYLLNRTHPSTPDASLVKEICRPQVIGTHVLIFK